MIIVHCAIILLFVVLAIVFLRGRGAWLIAGYNTSSKAEKEKYNEKALCRYMGILMLLLAACWLIIAIGTILETMWLFWLGFALFVIICISGAINANINKKLKR